MSKLKKLSQRMVVRKDEKSTSKIGKKCLAGLLAMTMSIGLGQVASNAANAPGTLGVCNIGNPGTYSSSGTTYNYVYFGSIPKGASGYNASSTEDTPILWRVLHTTANDDNATPALFMLTEYYISTRAWDENNNGSNDSYKTCGQIWDDYYATVSGYNTSYGVDRASTARGFLQGITSGKKSGASYATKDYSGNGVYQNCFSTQERSAIMTTVKTNESTPSNSETVKDAEGKNCKTEVHDNRGIKSIKYGEQVVTEGLEDYPKNVILQIKIVDALGLSAGSRVYAMDNDGSTILTITSDEVLFFFLRQARSILDKHKIYHK